MIGIVWSVWNVFLKREYSLYVCIGMFGKKKGRVKIGCKWNKYKEYKKYE